MANEAATEASFAIITLSMIATNSALPTLTNVLRLPPEGEVVTGEGHLLVVRERCGQHERRRNAAEKIGAAAGCLLRPNAGASWERRCDPSDGD